MLRGQEETGCANTGAVRKELISAECCTDSYVRRRVREQRRGKIQPATNCVALNPEGNHSNGRGLINLGNPVRDGVGSFMAAARSLRSWAHFSAKALPPLHGSYCMTLIVSSKKHSSLILYTKQFKQIYSSAAFLHYPNGMNKLNVDLT